MEEFLKLNWSKKFPKQLRYRKDVYSCGFDDEQDVYVCHLNEINPEFYGRQHKIEDLPQNSKKTLDSSTKSPQKDAELHLFRRFPNKSKMPANVHKSCLRYLSKKEDQQDPLQKDTETYTSCEETRKQEKLEFCEFVKTYFMTYLSHRYLKIDVGMEDILIERWRKNVTVLKQRKYQNYQLQTSLLLDSRLPEDDTVSLDHEKEIHRFGDVPKITCDFTEKIILEQNAEKLKIYLGDKPQNVVDIAEDVTADIDIILPVEAIEMLMNGMKMAWNTPFKVKEIGKRTLVIVEKPLPPLIMNTRQRNSEIFKYCLEMKILQPPDNPPELEIDNSPEIFEDALEYQSDDEENLVIADEEENKIELPVKLPKVKITTPHKPIILPESHVKTGKRLQNTSFRKFILSSGENQCKILLKSHQDAQVPADTGSEGINISTKIEYQAEFGAEEMTLEELIHEWCMQIFNPTSKTLRIRIDSQRQHILSVKEVSLRRIESDLERLYDLSSQVLLQRLYGVLCMIKNFPVQDYLMHHEVIHDGKLMIYVSRDAGEHDRNFLQLLQLYDKIDFKRKPLLEQHEWIPIDDQEVTLFHERENVLPCAFPHWGKKSDFAGMWNEKKNLIEKYEARVQAKKDMKEAWGRKRKTEKNRKKKERQMEKRKEKAAAKTEKFKKMQKILATSGDATVPDWFFDKEGRVKVQEIPGESTLDILPPPEMQQ